MRISIPDGKASLQRFAKPALCLSAGLALCVPTTAHAETIGLVITKWDIAGTYTADAKLECPNGFNPDNRANWRAQFKTEEERQASLLKYYNVEMNNRGPNGENVNYSPELVEDLLPYEEAQGEVSNGIDLDGTMDGGATAKAGAHVQYTAPDGRRGIDNQMYRVMACNRGMRPEGQFSAFFNNEIFMKPANRWIVEITEVDDRTNDDHVKVMVARGLDKLAKNARGEFIPGLSQRVDYRLPRYIHHTTGRIENGVLITDPIADLKLPATAILETGERRFKDAQLRLELTATGAKGVLAAYHDIHLFYRFFAKSTGHHGVASGVSPASIWAALKRNADGYEDSASGAFTAISGAYDIELVNAYIVHERANRSTSLERGNLERGNEVRP